MALTAALAVMLVACGPQKNPSLVDVRGELPPLALTMTRARDGAIVTGNDYRGKTVALYFGYTHCPDVCPLTLSNLADALTRLGPLASRVAVLFVTVDPARDDTALLQSYAAGFGPGIDGLRGTPDQLIALTRRYRVAFTAEPKTADGDYDVSHSSAVFVFDSAGRANFVITSTSDIGAVADGLRQLVTRSPTTAADVRRETSPKPG